MSGLTQSLCYADHRVDTLTMLLFDMSLPSNRSRPGCIDLIVSFFCGVVRLYTKAASTHRILRAITSTKYRLVSLVTQRMTLYRFAGQGQRYLSIHGQNHLLHRHSSLYFKQATHSALPDWLAFARGLYPSSVW